MVAQPSLSQVADSGPSGILAAAYDRLPVAVLCVRDKDILYANGAAATLLGVSAVSLKGRALAPLLKPDDPDAIDLGRMARADPLETLAIPHAGGDSCGALCDVSVSPAPTGRPGDWLLCLRPLGPGGCIVGPITDQGSILAHLLDAVGDAVLVVGNDGRIIDINKGAQRVFAVDREPARGMSIWPLLAPTLFEGEDSLPEASVQMLLRAVPRSTLGTGRSMTLSRADGISFPGKTPLRRCPYRAVRRI
jgi:PAS domain-containing protein